MKRLSGDQKRTFRRASSVPGSGRASSVDSVRIQTWSSPSALAAMNAT